VAISPFKQATKTVILSSGLHGVEGPVGSAIQLAFLEREWSVWRCSTDISVVLIHALNPFGYAHGRRPNEENALV
jgi:hypothetical protein